MTEDEQKKLEANLEKESALAIRAQWVKENKQTTKIRKQRTHSLILLGQAAIEMIEKGKLDREEITSYAVINKQPLIKEWISRELKER